jgi:FtsZ-binding cell division protein ZapB
MQLVEQLEEKVKQLVRRYRQLRHENAELQEKVFGLLKSLDQKQRHIAELEQRIQALQAAGTGSGEDDMDKKKLKKQLNGYIKELDKVIASLRKS